VLKRPPGQELQSLDPKDYENIIVVCGTRKWGDKRTFQDVMLDYLEDFLTPVLFVSGAAPSGADRLIINWARYYRYPCLQKPADWDTFPRVAGFLRNEEMAKIATHCLAFYDGNSPGTAHMLEMAEKYKLKQKEIRIPGNVKAAGKQSVFVSGCAV
jgi:hypothetical protein